MISKGRAAMGTKKHGKSGRAGKSPKMRAYLRREAEKTERRSKAERLTCSSVGALFNG